MTTCSKPDVLVIGGGIAALCAAIAARRAGASVRLIEHAPRPLRGGNARHARNLRVAHDTPTPFSPGRYTPAEYAAELERIGANHHDKLVGLCMAQESASVLPWLTAQGVPFQRARTGLLPVSRRTSFLLGGGKTMMNMLYRTAEKLGVTIGYESQATALTLSSGRIDLVDAATRAGPRQLRPRAVALCCGGAQADLAALRPFWGEAADSFIVRGTPYADGVLLRNLVDQGVATAGEPGACHLVAVDARSPQVDGGVATRVLGMPHGIVVDYMGRRFHDEGADAGPARYTVWGRKVAEQPRSLAWLILDATAMPLIPPPLLPPLSAGSLAALGEQAGLDAATFAATVAAFNDAVHGDGHTVGLVPPKTRFARRLLVPPFAAIPIRPGITFTCLGVKVNAQARVAMTDGAGVSNLFAAGTIMAPNVLGTGYLAGAGLTIGVVFGRRAGQAAARQALTSTAL